MVTNSTPSPEHVEATEGDQRVGVLAASSSTTSTVGYRFGVGAGPLVGLLFDQVGEQAAEDDRQAGLLMKGGAHVGRAVARDQPLQVDVAPAAVAATPGSCQTPTMRWAVT